MWAAHGADYVRALAQAQGIALTAPELWLRAQLDTVAALGFDPAEVAFLGIPGLDQRVDARMRRAILRHESGHGHFFTNPDFAAHIRRTRRVYGRRLAAMQEAMAPLGPYLRPEPTDAGLHLVASLGPRLKGLVTDQEIAAAAAAEGLHLAPLSAHYAGPPRAQGLLLGFAGFGEATIQAAMQRLGLVLARLVKD